MEDSAAGKLCQKQLTAKQITKKKTQSFGNPPVTILSDQSGLEFSVCSALLDSQPK